MTVVTMWQLQELLKYPLNLLSTQSSQAALAITRKDVKTRSAGWHPRILYEDWDMNFYESCGGEILLDKLANAEYFRRGKLIFFNRVVSRDCMGEWDEVQWELQHSFKQSGPYQEILKRVDRNEQHHFHSSSFALIWSWLLPSLIFFLSMGSIYVT